MHQESNEPRTKATVTEINKDKYIQLVKTAMLKELREEEARRPGPTADLLIFHFVMCSNWELPVSASTLYGVMHELEQEGFIEYDEDECNITLLQVH